MQEIAAERGAVYKERRFGETMSFEIGQPDGRRMSFQIAVRDVALDAPQASPWAPILIETLRDNLGSKMNALVSRSAPRDFLDIQKAVDSGLMSQEECWRLWALKNPGQSVADAKAKTLLNLENLEQRRPLDKIDDPTERANAKAVREWFRREFLQVTAIDRNLDRDRDFPDREPSPE